MSANDMTAELITKLQQLMKNHEKLRAMVEQNIKDKIELGFIRKIEPQNLAQPTQEEQIQQVQEIGKIKLKRELKYLNNDYINQIRVKNRIRKQLIKKKNAEQIQEVCSDKAEKISQNQDVQNSIPLKDANINEVNISQDLQNIKPEAIKKEVQEDNSIEILQGVKKYIYKKKYSKDSLKSKKLS